jgi:hypothetical protein
MLRLRFQSMRRYAALLGSFATVVALLTPISAQQRVVDVICGTGLTAADAPRAVDGDALFARQTPAILTADYTGRVELEIVSLGPSPHSACCTSVAAAMPSTSSPGSKAEYLLDRRSACFVHRGR